MKWRDVVQDYQQKQWDLMNIPSMYALEVFVASIELNVDILQWLPDPERKMKIRVKFHTLPCVELKGTFEENPQSVHKASMANIEKIKTTQVTPVRQFSEDKSKVKGFNPLLCLVKEKLEPPVPKVHKLPGEDDSESDLKKGEKAEDEKSVEHEISNTSQTSEKSAKNTKTRKSDTMDTKVTNRSLAEEIPVKSVAFNDGRSIIFTSTPTELIHSLMTIPLAINIFVNGPMVIGHTLLALHQFTEVVTVSIDSNKNIPCSAVLDGKFDIYNRGKYVGMVDLDLRLICLGQKMIHMITLSENPNEDEEVKSKGTRMSAPSMRVLKINVREKPFTSRMEKLLENEGTSEYFYPPSFKEATVAPPMLLSDDFFTMIDNMNAIEKTNVKPKKEWLKYKCTDMDTIIQRKVLEELIATQKPPFHKGSPFRKLVCPVYLKNKNIDWNEKRDKIYCSCDAHKNYIQCPAYEQPISTSTSGYKPQLNKGKNENDPNLFYDPYLQCKTIDYTNPPHLANCCMRESRIRSNVEIDPEEALKTVANINKKVEHYKKVLNDLVLDSNVNVYNFDPVENTTSKESGNDQNKGNIKTPFDEVTEQIIPQIIQKLPQLIASQRSQQIPRDEKYESIFQKGQWRCLKPVCRCQKY